jgi:hypothetical protein
MVAGTGEKIGTGEGRYLDEALLWEVDVEDEDLVLSVCTSLERFQIAHTILYEPQLLSGHSPSWRDLTDCARSSRKSVALLVVSQIAKLQSSSTKCLIVRSLPAVKLAN